ncbi:MAG: hypothetical protein A2Y03_05070 [Omnitrophica WOR_2 bacterium GWF2_38_59]|nr:MAG: hypothetical protein A2Y03_05070 [Omnitrophica WOR_2 bacterium GWF2_38_59]OGX48246.1 MAG: hypothetical protein A2243_10220 [Omnitrophica WOR_2 bacterium RIFOXYA2_FULL_38_17]OGX59589.1 MAG: hypothetical protein A2447_12080 [Omnitrophica WOR_2 bacterium RIFOXYC2_FULL_38_12]OGX59981.1 MAG: hypothetical protein A2306_04615 [Omnitrophica WOR_2 bacterium RIFOXYB2_FULL_38_16]
MFHEALNEKCLEIYIDRVKNIDLIWVEQFLDIISERICSDSYFRLNDIGCNLGQFWKGLKKREWGKNINYFGYDCDDLYLEEAKKVFSEISDNLFKFDVTQEKPPECDITVCSATLEHLENLQPGLDNMLQSTKKLFLLRTFLGEETLCSKRMIEDAKVPYNVHQFSFRELFLALEKNGFSSKVIRDKYTDSMPVYLDDGMIRTIFIVAGSKVQ